MIKKIINNIVLVFSIILNRHLLKKPDFSEKKIFLQGKILEEINKKKDSINNFTDIEFSVFSQFGEDGIISWLTDNIPGIKKVFVEIGTQDYWESNTRFLLKSKNWKGYLIEGSNSYVNRIKKQRTYWQNNIRAIEAFIDINNINAIISYNNIEKEIGLLSIDIDGNDYWILNQINTLTPSIIICEFNSIFGDIYKLSIPYNKKFDREKAHYSKLYFGASIQAMISMLKKKGYIFIGTGSKGINGFFVKEELMMHLKDKIKEIKIYPSQAREGLDYKGNLTYQNIPDSLKEINDLEVFDFDDNKKKKINEYNNLYSSDWKRYYK